MPASSSQKVVHPLLLRSRQLVQTSLLRPGLPASPGGTRLPLLPSGPDGVHRPPPRRTQSSTPLGRTVLPRSAPREGIRPRYSGLRVQGTASSPSSTTIDMLPQGWPSVKRYAASTSRSVSTARVRRAGPPWALLSGPHGSWAALTRHWCSSPSRSGSVTPGRGSSASGTKSL